MRRIGRKRIADSLIAQLEMKGADQDHFRDLVRDYMALWDVKNALAKDIKDRGVMYKDVNSVGLEMQKNNPSVRELTNINRQMLALLKELGISTDDGMAAFEDDEM